MIGNIVKNLLNHPLTKDKPFAALTRFIRWQVRSRLRNKPLVHNFIAGSKLLVKNGMHGATGNIYTGLHEFYEMSFLLHVLRPNDLFVDIGANVGVYTVLASAVNKARTVSFEPIPRSFDFLQKNIDLNGIGSLVTAHNAGVSSKRDMLRFTSTLDTVNHVAGEDEQNTIPIPVDALDNCLSATPLLMKIDVEGFETEVLKGADKILSDTQLKAIIIELNGSGTRYGYNELEIHNKLTDLGFRPFSYLPFERKLSLLKTFGENNTIYIRDLPFVEHRINASGKINVLGRAF